MRPMNHGQWGQQPQWQPQQWPQRPPPKDHTAAIVLGGLGALLAVSMVVAALKKHDAPLPSSPPADAVHVEESRKGDVVAVAEPATGPVGKPRSVRIEVRGLKPGKSSSWKAALTPDDGLTFERFLGGTAEPIFGRVMVTCNATWTDSEKAICTAQFRPTKTGELKVRVRMSGVIDAEKQTIDQTVTVSTF